MDNNNNNNNNNNNDFLVEMVHSQNQERADWRAERDERRIEREEYRVILRYQEKLIYRLGVVILVLLLLNVFQLLVRG